MDLPSPGGRRAQARSRRPQRVSEADPPFDDCDDVGAERRLQPAIRGSVDHLLEERDGRLGEGCCDGEGILRHGRQARQLVAEQRHQFIGQRQVHPGLEPRRLPLEGASELEREERVAARGGLDPQERRAGERDVDARMQELSERAEAQGSDGDLVQGRAGDRTIEPRRQGHARLDPACEQDPDRLVAEAADSEAEGERRGRVEPLDVVDRDEDRAVTGETPECVEERDGDRARFGPSSLGLLAQESHAQRAPLGVGQGANGSSAPSRRSPMPA